MKIILCKYLIIQHKLLRIDNTVNTLLILLSIFIASFRNNVINFTEVKTIECKVYNLYSSVLLLLTKNRMFPYSYGFSVLFQIGTFLCYYHMF